MAAPSKCPMCGRTRPMTKHHLIPKSQRGRKWFKKRYTSEELHRTVNICRDCHSAIHKFISSEKELGRQFSTLDDIMQHPEIVKYVTWVSKQKKAVSKVRIHKC